MSKQTLSIELDDRLVERVRRYSAEHGTDVAGTIQQLIERLPASRTLEPVSGSGAVQPAEKADEEDWVKDLPPLTRSLLGAGAGIVDEDDYKEYLWRKYGP